MKVHTEAISLDQLEYRWQDSEPDLAISLAHERYLNHEDASLAKGYQLGLRAGRGKGPSFVALFLDICKNGVREPCRVGPGNPGKYRMILGNQRLAIARALGMVELECEVYGPP